MAVLEGRTVQKVIQMEPGDVLRNQRIASVSAPLIWLGKAARTGPRVFTVCDSVPTL
jgi:hypothetical protein